MDRQMLCNGNYLESKALKKICLTLKYYGLLYAISFQVHKIEHKIYSHKGKDGCAKSDEFSEKFQGGWGHFHNKKINVADFGNFKQGFLSMKLIQKE